MNARPAGADAAVLLLDVGDQLVRDRVAVGAEIGRVHRVGIVVVRIGVLDLDDDHAREVRPRPFLVELVGVLLLDAVVAGEVKALAVLGLQVRVGRRLAKAVEVGGKVAVEDDERITRVRDACRTLRGKRTCAPRMHRRGPRTSSAVRSGFRMCLTYFCRLGRLDRRDDLVERRSQIGRLCRRRCGSLFGVL